MTTYTGTTGDDTFTGTVNGDNFDVTQGGNDSITAGPGSDVIYFGATFAAGDHLDGGADSAVLLLEGDYSSQLTITGAMLTNVQSIGITAGYSYNLKFDSSYVTADTGIYANGLSSANSLTVDASALTVRISITGGAGNDVLTGGSENDSFSLYQGGNDTVSGGDGDDTFDFLTAFTDADSVDGGDGIDTLVLNGNYSSQVSVTGATLSNVENIVVNAGNNYNLKFDDTYVSADPTVVNGSGLTASNALTIDATASSAVFTVTGGAGSDLLSGGDGGDTFDISAGGTDKVYGGAGDDIVHAGAKLTAADVINGGDDYDTLTLSGTTAVTLGATTVTNVEAITLGAGFNYSLTSNDATVAAGETLTVDGSALVSGNGLTFDGSAESDGSFMLIGGGGKDILTGGAGDDIIDISAGNTDKVYAGDGYDLIFAGGKLAGSDVVDGGDGLDTLILVGNYVLTLGATTLANVEAVALAPGFSYSLTMNDANVTDAMAVDASLLGSGNTFTFDGSAETSGSFLIVGGASRDTLTGGAGDDMFDISEGGNDRVTGGNGDDVILAGAEFKATDVIDGGDGDDVLVLFGDYGVTLAATSLVNVETIELESGFDYNLATNDANVAAGQTLTIDGSALCGCTTVAFYGAAETDGSFLFLGGWASEILVGGAGDDVFEMADGLAATDRLNGGNGNDTVYLEGDYDLTFDATTMIGVESIVLEAGYGYSLTLNDANVAATKTLTVDGSGLCGCGDLMFDGSAELDGKLVVMGGEGYDTIIGGAGRDTLSGGDGDDILNITAGGNDTVHGDGGDDTIIAGAEFKVSDAIDGGGDNDTLMLSGAYGLILTATNLVNVETIVLGTGFNYIFTSNDANVAAGATLTIDASALGGADSAIFNGAAETDGSFVFIGGAGLDSFTGGAGDDTFEMGAGLAVTDKIAGGAGYDTVILDGDYNMVFGSTTLRGVESLILTGGHDYDLTLHTSTIGHLETLSVDGRGLGSGNSLVFNGAAETSGYMVLNGGDGNDALTGGAAGATFIGGMGGDALAGGNGSDGFHYGAVIESSSAGYDTVADFDFAQDYFVMPDLPAGIDADIAGGLSSASFDSDLTAAITASELAAGNAVLFQANSGTLSGHSFMIVDANSTAGYQAGADYVVELMAPRAGSLSLGNFVAAS